MNGAFERVNREGKIGLRDGLVSARKLIIILRFRKRNIIFFNRKREKQNIIKILTR